MTYPQNPAVKLIIKKNRRVLGADNHFVYAYEWYNKDEEMILREVKKIQPTDMLIPNEELHDLEGHINHKIDLGIVQDRDSLTVEEIDV